MEREVLIIGLREIGASIGLALRAHDPQCECAGWDRSGAAAREAQKAGAVNRLVLSPARAARHAELLVLALPSSEVHDFLEVLAPNLAEGALVIDTGSLKAEAVGWAASLLPPGRHYVGLLPAANARHLRAGPPGQDEPSADLFRGGLLGMVVPPGTAAGAVERALNLGQILGARPFFLDPAEADAVVATTEDLPALLGAALLHVASTNPGWREVRRLAGRPFGATVASGALQDGESLRAALALNRPNVLNRLDQLIEELRSLRGLLADGEPQALRRHLDEAVSAHKDWMAARLRADWAADDVEHIEVPAAGTLERMLGIRPRRRPKDPPDRD
jgi:prephenate dehydrogenase